MNPTHLHLVITHLPIFGSVLGSLVLLYGIWVNSNHTRIAAFWLFIISAIGASIAYITGESAEETVEQIAGIAETSIEQHEDFAQFALVSFIILGAISIIGILTWKKANLSKGIAYLVLFISVISFSLVARTGYLGGKIRHTEISAVSSGQGIMESHEEDD